MSKRVRVMVMLEVETDASVEQLRNSKLWQASIFVPNQNIPVKVLQAQANAITPNESREEG